MSSYIWRVSISRINVYMLGFPKATEMCRGLSIPKAVSEESCGVAEPKIHCLSKLRWWQDCTVETTLKHWPLPYIRVLCFIGNEFPVAVQELRVEVETVGSLTMSLWACEVCCTVKSSEQWPAKGMHLVKDTASFLVAQRDLLPLWLWYSLSLALNYPCLSFKISSLWIRIVPQG